MMTPKRNTLLIVLFLFCLAANPLWGQSVVVGNFRGIPVYHFHDANSVEFASNAFHVIHPEASAGLSSVTIRDVKNARIFFLGEVKGNVPTTSPWQLDSGVVNLIDCENVRISGLNVENEKMYEPAVGLGKNESTAVCISSSKRISITNSVLRGNGKSVVVVHSDSDVSISDSRVSGYYFELQVGASKVSCEDVQFDQYNEQVGDSHAAIWVSSSMRRDADTPLFKHTAVSFKRCTFNLRSGRALISGNGSYDAKSNIVFETVPKISHTLAAVGLVILHKNYHSIQVELKQALPGLVDVVQSTKGQSGIGRFVVYHVAPGRPASQSPIIVDGVSSETLRL